MIIVRFFFEGNIEEEFFSFPFWNVCGNVTEDDGEFWKSNVNYS